LIKLFDFYNFLLFYVLNDNKVKNSFFFMLKIKRINS